MSQNYKRLTLYDRVQIEKYLDKECLRLPSQLSSTDTNLPSAGRLKKRDTIHSSYHSSEGKRTEQ
jgi:hypothetical protein